MVELSKWLKAPLPTEKFPPKKAQGCRAGSQSSVVAGYSFFKDGHTLRSDWSSPEFWISSIRKEDSGYYWCEALTASHSVSKQRHQSYIQVQTENQRIPVSGVFLETQPQGDQAVEGKMLVLVCSVAEGTGDTTFSWHRGDTRESLGQKIQRSQRAELEIPVIRESHAGGYYCTADNGYGLIQSEVVNVSVRIPVSHPVLTISTSGAQAFTGDVVELLCEDKRASPPILYRFYHENVTLGSTSVPFGGGASFNLSLTTGHSGNYACEADNGLGAHATGRTSPMSPSCHYAKLRLVRPFHGFSSPSGNRS
ncbi:Fc receptor-like protein 2 [Physeter macrocephalus]|uniref:Fc receptor-like protein 2 n=1 Tax=Physeter macrocephalus TaxID=9755 RepID=A0A2Y9FAE2_PHYMC|nr:Fc receptor-like protein 2 [Physeter catodon]|eukprot:XP_007118412.2 Fc receptor-like protein 2 [Physeter catodon]